MNRKELISVSLVSIAIIALLDLLTNSIDTSHNAWDFIYYIALARDGFNADPLASPFAYRYMTPGLVHLLTLTGLSIELGFQWVAYFGAFAQLTGVFIFTKWVTKSSRGAWLAMVVTALSLFNVKFLLFDIYRPDHLAYVLILVQTYFAFEKKFLPLLILTLIASQIREFNIVPLIAYLIMRARDKETGRPLLAREMFVSAALLLPAILLPRMLIPVTEDFQLVSFSLDGLINAVVFPFIPSVSVNFIFSVIAYLLPLAMFAVPREIKVAFSQLPSERRMYLLAYSVLILILSLLGGTDLNRFATFLFLPQIILIGLLAEEQSMRKILFVVICLFIFNRLWAHIPDWDVDLYRDFYGGFALRLNIHTLYRILELAFFLGIGFFIHRTTFLKEKI